MLDESDMMFTADIDCDNCGGITRVESEYDIIIQDVMCVCGSPCYNPSINPEELVEDSPDVIN